MGAVTFDKRFIFGAASAGHHVESNLCDDWTIWQMENASRLAKEAPGKNLGQGPAPSFQFEAMRTSNYLPLMGQDNQAEQVDDVVKAADLGMTGTRFSFEWSRIQPTLLSYDEDALDRYLCLWLIAEEVLGMEVIGVLNHFTLPLWAAELGGWYSPVVVRQFAKYAAYVAERLPTDRPKLGTINEPETYAMMTSAPGLLIPKRDAWFDYPKGWRAFFAMREQLAQAHRLAAAAIKEVRPQAQVGIPLNHTYFDGSDDPLAGAIRKAGRWLFNDDIAHKVVDSCDWLGLQYYFHCRVNGGKLFANDFERRSDMGWELYPAGIEPLLVAMSRHGKPIYVTESGLADAHDRYRAWYIEETLRHIAKAIERGVDCRGYFHFSLSTGKGGEWEKGRWPDTGLINKQRQIQPSAYRYAKIIANRCL